MTNEQWYAAGIMRSLHRYASDALVVVVVLHLLREFAMDRMRGKHFFAWLTGVPLLAFIYICGISGYWLVWDKLAQYIAVATSEWLDALPFFAEPIANNFLDSATLGGRFFTLMVLIHIFAPLFMLLLMWIHVQRHSSARVNPPRGLAIGTMAALVALSIIYPAVSQGPADLDVVPATVNLDWFYLAGYPLLEVVPGGRLWLYVVGRLRAARRPAVAAARSESAGSEGQPRELQRLLALLRRLPVQRDHHGVALRRQAVRTRTRGESRQLHELRHMRRLVPDLDTLSSRETDRARASNCRTGPSVTCANA